MGDSDWGTVKVLLEGYGYPGLAAAAGGVLAATITGQPVTTRLVLACGLGGVLFPAIYTNEMSYFINFKYKDNKNPGLANDMKFAMIGTAILSGLISSYAAFLTGETEIMSLGTGIGSGAGALAYTYWAQFDDSN